MTHRRLLLLAVPLYLICFACLGLFAWLIQDVHFAIESRASAIRTSTGWHYLLLPGVLPLIHLIAAMEYFGAASRKVLIKRYGTYLLAVALLVLYGTGWALESRWVASALEQSGYEACPSVSAGLRSVRIDYVMPGTSCESQ